MYKNIIANFISRFWSTLSNFIFVPLYIHFLGFESYSIISFTLIIAGLMAILDAGLTATLSREFAIKNTSESDKGRVFCTLETCYFLFAALIIVIMVVCAGSIANNWVKLNSVSPAQVLFYIKIIGVGVAFQLLTNFYIGGLLGLEKQVEANIYLTLWGAVRNGLVALPLLYSPTLTTFFMWQTGSTILFVILLRISLKRKLGQSFFLRPKIESEIISRVWKFAGGMLLISIITGVNTQMDKLAISKLLAIDQLGYYTLAISLAQGLVLLVNPVATAVLPRFTALYSENKNREAEMLYHRIFLAVSVIVFSVGANIMFNSKAIIWIWTGNYKIANAAFGFVPYLTVGMAMLSIVVLPYYIAIANGYTKINNYLGILSLFITLPGYWLMTKHFGAIGAAITWCVAQILVTFIFIYFINKRYFTTKSTINIYFNEIIKPAIIALGVAFALSRIKIFESHSILLLMWIGFATIVTLFTSFMIVLSRSDLKFAILRIKLKISPKHNKPVCNN